MTHFRAIKGAVPLKHTAAPGELVKKVNFRAIKGAVPLKHLYVRIAALDVWGISAPSKARSH